MNLLIVDTETAKLNGNACEIASLWVDLKDGFLEEGGLSCERFDPKQPFDFGAIATHHITPDMVDGCRPHNEYTLPDNTVYIVGHNVDYDAAVLQRAGVDLSSVKLICTLAMARKLYPELDSHTLGALMYFLHDDWEFVRNELKNAHSAAADVMFTSWILRKMVQNPAIKDAEELYQFSELCRVPDRMTFGKHKGMLIKDLPFDYRRWLLNQPDLDKYWRKALSEVV